MKNRNSAVFTYQHRRLANQFHNHVGAIVLTPLDNRRVVTIPLKTDHMTTANMLGRNMLQARLS
ncbi:hypothetical protein K1P63_002765 [Vibrio vulnificus]|nr:hypothetical protein [Vibrio vulnificus]